MVYDTFNPQVLRFILQDAREGTRILDVGCGTGRLGKELKDRIPCFITGIECDPDAAQKAGLVYDRVELSDLEGIIQKGIDFKSGLKYRYVIFGDVLEHVSNPQALLERFRDILEDDGFIIASIPNVANWMIRLRLLFGNFDYSGGILDQGHVRFFTYKTARKLLENSGYKIIGVINNNQTWLIRILGRLWKSMFAFQFVFKCIKGGEAHG